MKSPYRSPTTFTHTHTAHTHVDEVKALSRPSLHLFTNIDYFYNKSHSRRKRSCGGEERETAVIDIDAVALGHKWFTSRVEKKTHLDSGSIWGQTLFSPHNCFDMQLWRKCIVAHGSVQIAEKTESQTETISATDKNQRNRTETSA